MVEEDAQRHHLHHHFKEEDEREDGAEDLQDLHFCALRVMERVLEGHDDGREADEDHMITGGERDESHAGLADLSIPSKGETTAFTASSRHWFLIPFLASQKQKAFQTGFKLILNSFYLSLSQFKSLFCNISIDVC